jgi:mannan endo-1,4-beta-mannosidase
MMGYWKDYVTMLAGRTNSVTGVVYRDDPTILAWEIGNELRCASCRGGTRLVDTVRDLARYAKAAFPKHLIADGGEGFDDTRDLYLGLSNPYPVGGREGASFSKLLLVEELDMLSYHLYRPSEWGLDSERDLQIWIGTHELLARMSGKIAYMGEFGHDPVHGRPSAGAEGDDQSRARVFNGWLSFLFNHRGGQLGLLWQLLLGSRRSSADDGFGVVYDQHPRASAVLTYWSRAVQ